MGALAFLAVLLPVGVVIFFRRRFGRLGGRYFLGETAKVTVAALVMGAVVWRLNVAAELPFVKVAQYAACFLGDGLARFAALGLRLNALGFAGAAVYAGTCRLLGVREMSYVWGLVGERMGRLYRGREKNSAG